MPIFAHDPTTIEVFCTDLAPDDLMWVAHAPLNEFLAFLEDPTGWVADLANALHAPKGREFVLSDQFTIEIRGMDQTTTTPTGTAATAAPPQPEVILMGISGTGLVTVRSAPGVAQAASDHFTGHFVPSALPPDFHVAQGLAQVATTASPAPGADAHTIYQLNDDQFVAIYHELAGYKAQVTVDRTHARVFAHLKITDVNTMSRAERLSAVATFLFGCSADPSRLHRILNGATQEVHHYERGTAGPIPGDHPPVKFDYTLPTTAGGTAMAPADVVAAPPSGTSPVFVYSSDQSDDAEACDATIGSTDPTYTNGTTEVSFTKDYTQPPPPPPPPSNGNGGANGGGD